LHFFILKAAYEPCDLLLHGLCVCLGKEVEQAAAEVVGVAAGVAQLVSQRRQEQVPT
jgi:uncharacterized OsmC-like protein